MIKVGGKGMVGVLLLFVVLIVYTIWDNHRIIVVEQEIEIEQLPESLDGFTILQVTDLHERSFGENQKRLLEKVNSVDYDAIVFTGDMLDSNQSTNYDPFYQLIEGLHNRDNALYVAGNADPTNYRLHPSHPYEKSEFIKGMEQRGVNLLESVYTLEGQGGKVHFFDFELAILDSQRELEEIALKGEPKNEVYRAYLNHRKQLLTEISVLDQPKREDVLLALNHYPVVDARIDFLHEHPHYNMKNLDLLLAGHYHGGQIRVPFLGALFVPEPWYQRGGILPPRDRVKGLWEYRGIKQYVSTGLGSSDAIPLLRFRFLNRPEINVLTLKKKG
ncbi:metallophosphoesterase [Alkalihalobacillus sp. MEB130]|uniref:metallophosphoesterase n=1 Tax=Alkalihalobacillus sp. MEB130 TaxID=2976704 RepID=UPI0028E098F7|nr:metallophosphoesterase [Alkalihalobacillus sp. MEB130]MDT8861079.1 metallophosphoesterase [Alkalihalobacillus sp. MEB130]